MKRFQTVMAASALVACASAAAEDFSFSGGVALTTDYVFRGISQTNEKPAIQGNIDLNHTSGFYAGIWGSNVDFKDGGQAQAEFDLYAGIGSEAGPWGWDVGYLYYVYPGADSCGSEKCNYDYWEVYGSLSYGFDLFTPTLGVYWANDYFGSTGTAWYPYLDVDVPLGETGLGLGLHLGHQTIDEASNYTDWKVGLTYPVLGVDLELAYTDTNLSKNDCGGEDICDARAVFTVSKSF